MLLLFEFRLGLLKKMRQATSLVSVTLCVTFFYVIFTVIALGVHDWNPLWFVWMGEKYADLNPNGRTGYDGQFIYYIARYGSAATPHLDNPAYRWQRILLPVTVRLFSMGSSVLIPWIIIAVNVIAIVLTTYLLAEWLDRQNLSPWFALAYALYIGTIMAFARDLTEPVAFCLVTWGISLWLQGKHAWGTLSLALAALAKETTLLFVFGLILHSLIRRNLKLAFGALAATVPLLVWECYLLMKLGTLPLLAGPTLESIPLNGIIPHMTMEPARLSSFFVVGLPALVLLPVSLFLLKKRGQSPTIWWLFLHCVFVVLMPFDVYDHIMHSARNASGLVLSALFALPFFRQSLRFLMLSYWIFPTSLWLMQVLRWAPWLSTL